MSGIIYLAHSPNSNKAVIGYGRDIISIINRLKNANSPTCSAYFPAKLIKSKGGMSSWNFTILDELDYYNREELYKLYRKYYDDLGTPNFNRKTNNDIIDWNFEEIKW